MILSHLFGVFILFLVPNVWSSPAEDRLIKDLKHGYIIEERPVIDSSEPVKVQLGVSLQQIIDVNEKEEQLSVNMWLKFSWKDENLRWDPIQYENVTDIRHPVGTIWQPDILLYNSVDTVFDSTYKSNILGYKYTLSIKKRTRFSDGTINWIPPGIFKVSCKIDVYYFPWDEQICFFKFGSWSFSGRQIDLQPGDFDLSEYMENGEWIVVKYWVNRSEKFYDCCPEPYQDLKFFLHLKRRTLYYAFNLIMPCALIMILVVLGFTLSPDSGEKVGLQISVSLAICIFMTIISEMTPRTSEAVPLLGIFFQSCMLISVCATGFTVYVQNVHFRNHENHKRMEFWARTILLEWMPYVLHVKSPEWKRSIKKLRESFKERKRVKAEQKEHGFTIVTALKGAFIDNFESAMVQLQSSGSAKDAAAVERLRVLDGIYRQIKKMRESNDESIEENKIRYEWQFAAIVIDRLGLVLFFILLMVTTFALIFRAPYLMA